MYQPVWALIKNIDFMVFVESDQFDWSYDLILMNTWAGAQLSCNDTSSAFKLEKYKTNYKGRRGLHKWDKQLLTWGTTCEHVTPCTCSCSVLLALYALNWASLLTASSSWECCNVRDSILLWLLFNSFLELAREDCNSYGAHAHVCVCTCACVCMRDIILWCHVLCTFSQCM